MTNKEIINLYEGLAELYNLKLTLNIKVKYILAKIKIEIEPLYQAIMLTRNDLIKQYSTEDESSFTIKNGMLSQFSTEMNDLMKIETKIEVPKINLEDLDDSRISVHLIEKLLPIINN